MSALKGNSLLPVGVVIIIGIVGVITFSGDNPETESGDNSQRESASTVEMTPKEEVKLLAEQLQELRERNSGLAESVTQRVVSELSEAKDKADVSAEDLEKMVERKLSALLADAEIDPSNAPPADSEVDDSEAPVASLPRPRSPNEKAFQQQFEINGEGAAGYVSEDITWEYPVGYQKNSEGIIESMTGKVTQWGERGSAEVKSVTQPKDIPVEPFITIPSDSRIYDVQAVTALVGRIEKNGNNKAPWGFSATLSGDASLANGFNLPEVQEARVSGVAIGDLAGKCVKGFITSVTFIFPDGRIANKKGSFEEPLARIADEYGNPCIPGVYFDNINEVIAAQGSVSGLSSIAKSIEQRQQSIQSTATSQSLVLDGSSSLAALGSGLSGGLAKTGELLAEKYDAFYSFVYVEPGETITLLIDNNIAIDYDPNGRKVRYDNEIDFAFN